MSEDELELINKILKGDKKAFEEIIINYQKLIYSTCFKFLKNTEDAEDMTQEVFIIIFKNMHKFKFQSSLVTWIYKICVNTCLNKLKTLNKYKLEELSDNIPSKDIFNPYNTIEVHEEKSYILSQIETLNKKSNMIIKLRLVGDKSFTEIANMLNIPISSARTSYIRSRDYLKKSIIKFRKD